MKRLNLEFSAFLAISAAIFFFGSFLGASYLINRELARIDKIEQAYVESELKSYRDKFIGDVLLQHREALEIAIPRARQSLNIARLVLQFDGGQVESVAPSTERGKIKGEVPLIVGDQQIGRLTFEARSRLDQLFLRPLVFVLFVFFIFIVILFVFVSRWMEKRLFRPIHLLIRSSREKNSVEWLKEYKTNSVELAHIRDLILNLTLSQQEKQKEIGELEKRKAFSELASQVAHDIRSPLAALSMATSDIASLPEDLRVVLGGAISRIRDIANDLLEKKRNSDEQNSMQKIPDKGRSVQLLTALLETITTEKRLQFRARLGLSIELNLKPDAYCAFALIEPAAFLRTISNLVNNSAEAIEGDGRIDISVERVDDRILIEIRDTGKGFPKELIAKVGRIRFTFGKKEGTGLGLSHAFSSVESWGGKLTVERQLRGTVVSIELPAKAPPALFVRELRLRPHTDLVIVDDDSIIHQIWTQRIERALTPNSATRLHHLSGPQELTEWISKGVSKNSDVVYLVDYEFLGVEENGLMLIKRLGIEKKSILVTSRFEQPELVAGCEELGVRMIPKTLAAWVPIVC